MKLHYIILCILAVSIIVLGSINYVTDLGEGYETSVDLTGLNKTNERLENQQSLAQNLSNNINAITLDEGTVTGFLVPYRLLKAAWGSVKLFFNSWATVGTMVEETGEGIAESGVPLPEWFIPSITAFLVVILMAILIYAIFKWRFSD